MEVAGVTTAGIVLILILWARRVLNWLWLRPKKLERLLREQGLQGNPYRILVGDLKDLLKMQKEAKSKPMSLSDDIVPRVSPYLEYSVNKHGMCDYACFPLFPICCSYLFASLAIFGLVVVVVGSEMRWDEMK